MLCSLFKIYRKRRGLGKRLTGLYLPCLGCIPAEELKFVMKHLPGKVNTKYIHNSWKPFLQTSQTFKYYRSQQPSNMKNIYVWRNSLLLPSIGKVFMCAFKSIHSKEGPRRFSSLVPLAPRGTVMHQKPARWHWWNRNFFFLEPKVWAEGESYMGLFHSEYSTACMQLCWAVGEIMSGSRRIIYIYSCVSTLDQASKLSEEYIFWSSHQQG